MSRFKFRTQYEGDEAAGKAAGFACLDPITGLPQESQTQQSFAREADLNIMAAKFGLTDQTMPQAPVDPSYYGDVRGAPDLRGILDMARDAQEKFDQLPPAIRARFHNDPAALWKFVNKKENWKEAVEMGLLQEHKAPAAAPAPGSPATSAASGSATS